MFLQEQNVHATNATTVHYYNSGHSKEFLISSYQYDDKASHSTLGNSHTKSMDRVSHYYVRNDLHSFF
jgi:hypothetical protein